MKMISLFLTAVFLASSPAFLQAKLRVVTTTEDLASLVREVGGDSVRVQSIAKGYQDPHFVEVKPSYLLKLKKADLFVQVGLELEAAWVPALLTNARNPKILPGQGGFLDASVGCEILQKIPGSVDRSMGDIHPFGNPHYWLDPENGRVIARRIFEALASLSPEESQTFKKNLNKFEKKLNEAQKRWAGIAESIRGTRVVTYHNSWPNFAHAFGLEVVEFVEPKPGVPPTPSHLIRLQKKMKAEKIPIILIEPYFDPKISKLVAQKSGAHVVTMPPSVRGIESIKDYFSLFDFLLEQLAKTLRKENDNEL